VDDRGADAVQTTRDAVILALELPARVQRAQDELERRALELGMDVDRDAAPVVDHARASQVFVQHDLDLAGVAVDGLVDRVIHDLPERVVRPRLVGAADVHGGTFADRLEPLENFDVFGGVSAHDLRYSDFGRGPLAAGSASVGTTSSAGTLRSSLPR